MTDSSQIVDELIRAVARRGGVQIVPGESLDDAIRRAARELRGSTTLSAPPDDQPPQEAA